MERNLNQIGRRRSTSKIAELHKAALKGDWIAAHELFNETPNLITTPITEGGEIALHVAAVEGHETFISKLLEIMEQDDVAAQNEKGCTALCFAAAAGHIEVAKLMLKKDPNLAKIKGDEGVWPLYMAALQGYGEMADYLYDCSELGSWSPLEKVNLLTSAIDSELYDLAIKIVLEDKTLAMAKDGNGEAPLQVLARKPLAFSRDNGHGFWDKIKRSVLAYMKNSNTNVKCDAYALMDRLWEEAELGAQDVEFFIAAKSGNDEFLVELLKNDHNLLYKVNEDTHSIFHVAVLCRYIKVFNLMYELGGTKDLIATYIDNDGNNLLHLAGKLAPQSQLDSIPGAAWQMQREVLWFKAVENLVRPSFRHKKNKKGQTPRELYMAEHKELRAEGEKFMKQAAKSCMVVTMLVATLVITTAFTIPGGYNSSGAPILQSKRMFAIFPVSEAVAALSSLTSMLMFLSILMSRYTDQDFLTALPIWMVVGVSMLFFSIVAMIAVFCSCLLFFKHGLVAKILILVMFGSVPVVFVALKLPLLITILQCTHSRTWFFRSHNRLHS